MYRCCPAIRLNSWPEKHQAIGSWPASCRLRSGSFPTCKTSLFKGTLVCRSNPKPAFVDIHGSVLPIRRKVYPLRISPHACVGPPDNHSARAPSSLVMLGLSCYQTLRPWFPPFLDPNKYIRLTTKNITSTSQAKKGTPKLDSLFNRQPKWYFKR